MSDPLAKMQRLQKRLEHEKRKEENRRKQREEEKRRRQEHSSSKPASPSLSKPSVSFSPSVLNGNLKPWRKQHAAGVGEPSPQQPNLSSRSPAPNVHRKSPIQSIIWPSPAAKRKLRLESAQTAIDEKWLDKPASKRTRETETNRPPTGKKPASMPTPKQLDSDDSSDDDIDLLAHFRKIKGLTEPKKNDIPTPKESIVGMKESPSTSSKDTTESNPPTACHITRHSLDKSSADDSSDESVSRESDLPPVSEKNKSLMDNSSDEEMLSPLQCALEDSDVEKKEKAKVVLNPITLAQQEQRLTATAALQASPKKTSNNNQDDLWGDSDNDIQADESDDQGKKPRGRHSRTKKGIKSKRTKSASASGSPGRKKAASFNFSDGGSKYWYLRDDDSNDTKQMLKTNDEEGLTSTLHPEIDYPFFGPFEPKPFVLGEGSGTTHSIPASLSRYLAPYQKAGINFMHKCLTSNQGTIMGDEMGLGKTVQVIGLLSALFEKTGTGMDLLKIKKRHEVLEKEKRAAEMEREKALIQGRFDFQVDIATANLDLSPWHPVLVIAPPSVVDNWKDEFAKFSNFAVAVYSGDKSFRERELEKIRDGRAEILIAAKSMFQNRNTFESLDTIRWKLVVIDEFHTFKNGAGRLSEHLRELKANHRCLVLGMTGTLMQNDHKELWNLIDLVETNFLGTWEDFRGDTADAIKYGRQKDADQATIERSKQKASALNKQLAKIFIERRKDEVLGDLLTNKRQDIVLCPPSELQKRVFEHIMTLPDVQLVKMGNSPCDCGVNQAIYKKYYKLKTPAERVRYIRENQKQIVPRKRCCYRIPLNPHRNTPGQPLIDPDDAHDETNGTSEGCERCPYCIMFPILNKLNKLCSHIGSLQAERTQGSSLKGSGEHRQFMKDLEFAKVALPHDVIDKIPGGLIRNDTVMDKHFELSGKLKKLDQLLSIFTKDGSKVLLFSYSTKTLDFIQNYVRSRGFSHLRIDGSVKAKNRQDLCNKFNDDPNIFLFLLSTKACGLGLNLTSANKVIIFDVEWNPSWDDQAQDRAYRIGQTRDVRVIRLIAEGTVDELYKVQLKDETLGSTDNTKAKAARLFRAVQGEKHRKGELFGAENLLKFKRDGSFLSDVWKSKKSKNAKKQSSAVEIHEAQDLSAHLNTNKCVELFDSSPAEDIVANFESQASRNERLTGRNASNMPKPKGHVADEETNAGSALDDSGGQFLNQEDLMRSDRGSAVIEAGDEGYEEEMGEQTQNAYAAFAALSRSTESGEGSKDRHGDLAGSNQQPVAGNSIAQPGKADSESCPTNAADEMNGLGSTVNHQDLFDEEEGGAALEQGDDGYEEEMGGGTQNDYAIYENIQLPENPQDAMDEDDVDTEPTLSQGNQQDNDLQNFNIRGAVPPSGVRLNPGYNEEQRRSVAAATSSRMESVEEKSSFFSSRQAKERHAVRRTEANAGSSTRNERNADPVILGGSAKGGKPNSVSNETAARVAEASNKARAGSRASKKQKNQLATRPAIAILGKTSSQIAKKGSLDIQLPNYKRKKRKKQA
eukprot:scaffold1242_cov123-Cylindrotheca_fusiformis.AAC.8